LRRAEEAITTRLELLGEAIVRDLLAEGFAAAPAAMFRRAADSRVADQISFDVEPVPQTVAATVEARFTATQPEF
jgi:hypothetical protein